MMNSTINTDNVDASVEIPTLDATLSANTLIGQSSANALTGNTTANTLIGSIGNGVIVSGIRSIYVNNIEQTVIGDTAYISLSYNILTDKPTIPTKTSDLINDSGFINSGYVTTSDFISLSNQVGIIQNTLEFTNDDIEEIQSDIEEINTTLIYKVDLSDFDNLQTQVTTNTNNIGTNTTNITRNTNNITTLTNIVDSQAQTLTSATAQIEDNSDAIGTLSNLTTTDKTNLVSAINEVKSDIPTKTSDLTNDSGYVTATDYANSSTGGVIKTSSDSGTYMSGGGVIYSSNKTYSQYQTYSNNGFISKGTLENVITGKQLVNSTDLATKQDTLVSGTNIKTINSQSILGSGDITITGGQATDVQINGTSITSNNTANIETNSTYNATTNKIATMSDLPVIPTNVSTFTNDAGYITNTVNDLTNYTLTSNLATVATTGDYDDLTNKPTIPTVPANVSAFTNDAGYITATDYASRSGAGTISASAYFGTNVDSNSGALYADSIAYATYQTKTNNTIISKGTLENVITGKNLASNSTYTVTPSTTYIDYTTNLLAYRVGNMLFVCGAIDIKTAVPQRTTFITINGINSSISGNQFGGEMHQAHQAPYRLRALNDGSDIVIQVESSTGATGWYNLMFIIFI